MKSAAFLIRFLVSHNIKQNSVHIIEEEFWSEKQLILSNYSQDPIMQTIWNEKIGMPYQAVPQIRPVYDGEQAFIDWKSSMEPAIFVRYSTPAGDPLIHMSPNPLFMPKSSGKYFTCLTTGLGGNFNLTRYYYLH